MRRIIISSLLLTLSCLQMAAQLNGSGFYRFRNADKTTQYISMTNDKMNYTTAIGTACGGLWKAMSSDGQARAFACVGKYLETDIHLIEDAGCVNPASVIYAAKKNTNSSNYDYNLIGQGTSLLTLTTGTYPGTVRLQFYDLYVTIKTSSGSGVNTLYTASMPIKAQNNSMADLGICYLVDDNGTLAINSSSSAKNAKWYIEPVNHFNVQPEVSFNGKYYTTLYVPFAFTLSGQVENAYAVNSIGNDGLIELETLATSGETVLAGTPVLLECGSESAADCRLIPVDIPLFTEPDVSVTANAPSASTATNYTGTNLLKGNYYCNTDGTMTFATPSGTGSFNANHYTTRTNSMYVIGITASGKLGMVKATGTAMPANKAWIEYTGTAELVFPFQNSIPGDVNKDGGVDVGDVVATVNIIQGRDSGFDYDYNAADIDGNGTYDVTDVTGIVNIIQGRQ